MLPAMSPVFGYFIAWIAGGVALFMSLLLAGSPAPSERASWARTAWTGLLAHVAPLSLLAFGFAGLCARGLDLQGETGVVWSAAAAGGALGAAGYLALRWSARQR